MATQELASKERSLFAQVVKNYENKQYKKGLKAAEQILRKKPDHGDTIAMKALIINGQGNSEEAFGLAKTALQKSSMKSHICWHVYGLLYRSNKNFEEAIKAYKFALKLEPDSHQIQKDLALLQMQMRDHMGYVQSRRAILQNKTMWRQNWTALAVAQHLDGDLWGAERTLSTYEETLRSSPPRSDLEHAEAVLYKNTIIAEMGDLERALNHLDQAAKDNPDRGWVMERRAQYLLQLGRKEEAGKTYQDLLDRNSEYRAYYDGLAAAKGLSKADTQELKALYDGYASENPRGDAARRIPLDFLDGDDFREAADQYLQRMLHRGVPSTFANIKALYTSPDKCSTIQALVEGYISGEGLPQTNGTAENQVNDETDRMIPSAHYFLAKHYNYHLSRNLDKAMQHIEEAIKTAAESVDYHQTKARIWKHYGNFSKASETMEYARSLDTRDRYINTKAAKYQLRNNETDAAVQNMSKFTRNEAVGGPVGDLHDMQCQWFIYEDAMSHLRQGKLGLALKRFQAIYNIFDIWQDDQFDFHSFSLRKGQIRAYVDMIRWEDHLRAHPFFARAALAAANVYIRLHDQPKLALNTLTNGINGEHMDAAERKKARKKAKKEQEKAAEANKKDGQKKPALDQNGDLKKEDKDPNGDQLLQTSDSLGDAMKFINPLLEYSSENLEVQQTAFQVFLRRHRLTPALRSLQAAYNIAPSHPLNHHHKISLRYAVNQRQDKPNLSRKAFDVLEDELSTLISKNADLFEMNDKFIQENHDSAPHVQVGLQVKVEINEPTRKEKCSQDMIRTLALETSTLEDATRGLDILRGWKADQKYIDDYIAAANARYPQASAFRT
ncbi:uncharacterized protein KY384_002071 [Bacidia gigantensis]|uniref:uncharacterized protein n=1 Tax=Bacidia gigantensis TaxID=2732470 RepID=UPI001D05BE72|nr:uncharacterized protein KY384_002071 [Bacidia gigantensis]KAG8533288.1 hypothetical protein KY384_002071 [Bacidia gigantensis]